MNLAGLILKIAGWSVRITVPDYPKVIICVAPHTSNWDFVLGKLAYWSVCRKAGFLMKESWFFFPLGYLFRAIGGIPVSRNGSKALVNAVIERLKNSTRMAIAITPEGTRGRTSEWHTGFLRIAEGANVPVVLGAIDFGRKQIVIEKEFEPTSDVVADMKAIKSYYSRFTGKYPNKFTTE